MKNIFFFLLLIPTQFLFAQKTDVQQDKTENLAPLTVKKIMRDSKWIGTSPSNQFWSPNGEKLYFDWNPEQAISDSLYFITLKNHTPQKATPKEQATAKATHSGSWNSAKTKITYKKDQALYLLDVSSQKLITIIETTKDISNPRFGLHDSAVIYKLGDNLFSRDLKSGTITQVTNFKREEEPSDEKADKQKDFLKQDALENSQVLRKRKEEKEIQKQNNKRHTDEKLKPIYIDEAKISDLSLSPDGKYVVYRLATFPDTENTIVPNYVTESGYTEDISARSVVGVDQPKFETFIYNLDKQISHKIDLKQIPGIQDIPVFIKENYPDRHAELKKDTLQRQVRISTPIWNKNGSHAFVVVRSQDHKDRWIMTLDVESGKLKMLNRQHDDAWIAGPGIGYSDQNGNVGWLDENTIWYQSEKTGYSHLYTQNIDSQKEKALTSGEYEVQEAELSPDRKSFYITTNKIEPGQRQFYQLNIKNKKQTRITHEEGGYQVEVSPDGKHLAALFSTAVHPWELYLQPNKSRAKAEKITEKAESAAYKSYDWQTPEITTFKDRDGFEVYAEVYKPEHQAASKPGVIFVHGAGYLQDVLKSWGYYPREHMFINLLTDQGYTVMNIDYRGSSGYGRDWRTAIYRHMGKSDLADVVDGADYMVKNLDVNPENIGLWGGSYGGFMTLMAMFKTDTFKSGGALRSVTDWAHYNHGYTSDILNLPQNDSIAYQQSSPIYFADGLQGNLLMAHGMVDTNVHFQDIVRLTQKLIELEKENWELAVYPVENHGFVEPSSWTDEYRRIFELFERTLK